LRTIVLQWKTMLTGAPLPIAILNRKPIFGGASEVRVESGRSDIARVFFPSSGVGFTAIDAGKFLAIWSTETMRQEISVAVASPSSAAIARNENAWKIRSFDQLMAVSYAPLVGGIAPSVGNRWNVSSHTKQTRSFMPFEHVSHSWLCDLDAGETSALAVTIADATQLKWMLAVIRIAGPTVEQRNANTLKGLGSPSPGTGVTCLPVSTFANVGRWFISSTVSSGTVDIGYPAPRAGIAYTSRVRLIAASGTPSAAGSVTVSIRKNSTVLASNTMTIPVGVGSDLPIGPEWALAVLSTEFTGSELLTIRVAGIDAGERFLLEFSFDAA
jgi:hypothetical protein